VHKLLFRLLSVRWREFSTSPGVPLKLEVLRRAAGLGERSFLAGSRLTRLPIPTESCSPLAAKFSTRCLMLILLLRPLNETEPVDFLRIASGLGSCCCGGTLLATGVMLQPAGNVPFTAGSARSAPLGSSCATMLLRREVGAEPHCLEWGVGLCWPISVVLPRREDGAEAH